MTKIKEALEGAELKAALAQLQEAVAQALALLKQGDAEEARAVVARAVLASGLSTNGGHDGALRGPATKPTEVPAGSRMIEGVFDGQHMMGADGKQYLVPPNYASKSKLVEGDMMKLSITPQGAFIYKQIGPIERQRVTCALESSENGLWQATDGVHRWRLLTAAVSFFKGGAGDEVIILIPSATPSKWAAVENIIAR